MRKTVILTSNSKRLDIGQAKVEISKFIDGEISIKLDEKLENKRVYVVGSTQPPSDNLLELLFLIDMAYRRGASKITAIIPYFGYSRSDKETKQGEVACGQTVLKLMKAVGGKKLNIITFDIHSHSLKNHFTVPVSEHSLIPQLADNFTKLEDLAVVAPDKGAEKNARHFAQLIHNTNVIVLNKKRLSDSKVIVTPISNKCCKNAVIVDDMIASGNTIIEASKVLRNNGVKNIYVAITHMLYTAGGWKKLSNLPWIKGILLSNTIPPQLKMPTKFKIIDIAPILKKLIKI
jgi:ribose-phosphate pyrophosphokinase